MCLTERGVLFHLLRDHHLFIKLSILPLILFFNKNTYNVLSKRSMFLCIMFIERTMFFLRKV